MRNLIILFTAISIALSACQTVKKEKDIYIPAEDLNQLFADVQQASIFPDSKSFPDYVPQKEPAEILESYKALQDQPDFDLSSFVETNFYLPQSKSESFQTDTSLSVAEHIKRLWPVLTREPDTLKNSSLIPLPLSYIVPGGRFREIYYWDSYFTMLGLSESPDSKYLIRNMVENFAFLIDTLGFIPNGNRTYYLSRSQPPFFSSMVALLAEIEGDSVMTEFVLSMEDEYQFWMEGLDKVPDTIAYSHVVQVDSAYVLNRYYDAADRPRTEAYKEDIEIAEKSDRAAEVVYRDIRSACESGWDFSSRWFRNPNDMSSIHTTDIIPADLNALLYQMELHLMKAYELIGDSAQAAHYSSQASSRKEAYKQYLWDEENGIYRDYDWKAKEQTPVASLAMMYPLYFELASTEEAARTAQYLEENFLMDGGLPSTLVDNGQQWDTPNGWAPLQYIAIEGLRRYGHDELANTIRDRWIEQNLRVFKQTGKLVEKYDVMNINKEAGGGEYPLQDGFGWTNGVLLKLLSEGK